MRTANLREALQSTLLMLLSSRSLEPTETQLVSLRRCTDPDRLRRWILAASQVQTVEELLALDS